MPTAAAACHRSPLGPCAAQPATCCVGREEGEERAGDEMGGEGEEAEGEEEGDRSEREEAPDQVVSLKEIVNQVNEEEADVHGGRGDGPKTTPQPVAHGWTMVATPPAAPSASFVAILAILYLCISSASSSPLVAATNRAFANRCSVEVAAAAPPYPLESELAVADVTPCAWGRSGGRIHRRLASRTQSAITATPPLPSPVQDPHRIQRRDARIRAGYAPPRPDPCAWGAERRLDAPPPCLPPVVARHRRPRSHTMPDPSTLCPLPLSGGAGARAATPPARSRLSSPCPQPCPPSPRPCHRQP
uniref:Uncharacterized protein n=1 Tax=Oryza glumipatula TaxID=40148 RepID=A0A0E0BQB4_9ORYZ